MAKESSMWRWLKKGTRGHHVNRVENLACPGMPDVEGYYHSPSFPYNHGQFWLELKQIKKPVRETTKIKIRNLRPTQELWLNKRWEVGACCYLLLQIGSGRERLMYMIAPPVIAELTKGVDYDWLNAWNVLTSSHHLLPEQVLYYASCRTNRRTLERYKAIV